MADPIARIDRWLWAARFYKTRSGASQAVAGGHVQVNGARVKPSRVLRPGDELTIRKHELEWTVIVEELARRRGPASEAATLYRETAGSIRRRETRREERRLRGLRRAGPERRPDKKQRRDLRRFFDRFLGSDD